MSLHSLNVYSCNIVDLFEEINKVKNETRWPCKHMRGNLSCSFLNKKAFEKKQLDRGVVMSSYSLETDPLLYPSRMQCLPGPTFERWSASLQQERRTRTWQAKCCSSFVKVGLKIGQGNLRRIYVKATDHFMLLVGALWSGSLPQGIMFSTSYKEQRER